MATKTFPSKSTKQGFDKVTVTVDAADDFVIEEKDPDPGAPSEYEGQTITWICNFAVKSKGIELKKGGPSYSVSVNLPDSLGTTERNICVYDPDDKKLNVKGKGIGKDVVKFNLDFGDPPVGIFP